MTSEEIDKLSKRLNDGLDMISEKAEQIGRSKEGWTLGELGMIADLQKDLAKALKSLVCVHKMISESPIEKY